MSAVNRPESIPLAIVGMGCRLPGADNLEEFWKLISEGRCAVREMPADRMDRDLYFDPQKGVRGKTYSTLAATLSSREFDRRACPLPESLIRGVDNAHLLMCGVAAEALRHAGIDPFDVPLRNTGVYVGHAAGSELASDYTYATCVDEAAEFLRESPAFLQLSPQEQDEIIRSLVAEVRERLPHRTPESPDVSACMVAGTVSKAFGLTGPFLAINSACASSLQAMLLAARALQLGHVDMAIAGGASDCKGDSLVLFSHAQAMSATGSRPFDADADGLIVGEGYVAVVMKRLDRALADGDDVLAVIRGLGISSDGKGKSLWAPRKEGQIKAMERAYRSGVDLAGLQYLEAHSTATQLGDATELNTLSELLAPHFPPGHKIPVTSVKANIGHTLESAGLAGVIKTVLCMQHGVIPAAINIDKLNPNIDWENAPVYVPLTSTPWPKPADGKPRRAGVNAFGIGGLNMHVVLDEFTEASRLLIDQEPDQTARSQSRGSAGASPSRNVDDAIAVIGRGCIFPGAGNLTEYWRLLLSGEDPKQHIPADRWRSDLAFKPNSREAFQTPFTLGGFITDYEHDWRRHKIPPKQIQQADPLQFMLLDAMDEAFAEAGYDQREFDRSRAGVVVGTEFGGDFAFQLQVGLRLPELGRSIERLLLQRGVDAAHAKSAVKEYEETLLKHWPALIDESGSFSTSTLASRLGKTWNLMGGAAAVDAGDASSLSALSIAIDMLLAGDCDMMVCAGGQRRMGLPEYETLALNGLLPDQDSQSPLDAHCDGYVPGEGVGVVLLKRLSDAQRDGDPIQAIIHGVSAAHHNEPAKSIPLVINRTEMASGITANALSVIELDATGSSQTTEKQLSAIAESQRSAERDRPLILGSMAHQIGHTQGAAGIASLLKATLELSHGETPAHRGISQLASAIKTNPDLLQVASTPTSLASFRPDQPPMAAVMSYSRGLVYQTVLQSGAEVAVRPALPEQEQKAEEPQVNASEMNSATTASAAEMADLESFLINFVVEQTGYPPEVVELDADLEADLGIDSIKKAQLFGELQEYFDITPTGDVTLDDFPTLRHVVNFLADQPAPQTTAGMPSDTPKEEVPRPAAESTRGSTVDALNKETPSIASEPAFPTVVQPDTASEDCCTRIHRFGGSSWDEIDQQLNSARSTTDEVFEAAATASTFSPSDRYRMAIVADSPATLARKLEQATAAIKEPSARRPLENQGIFIRERASQRLRIAFVFPGQGSQYGGMLRELVQQCPSAEAEMRRIDDTLKALGEESFGQIAWSEDGSLGIDVWATQLAVLLADSLMCSVLKERGIQPDLVLGHSYGEYAALVAAGAWELAEAIRVTRARCDGIEGSSTSHGGMLATNATAAELQQLLADFSGDVFLANHNAPDQTVVGGRRPALRELDKLLKAKSRQSRMLPVPCAFHTPLMQDAVPPLEAALAQARIAAPQLATFSVANNRLVTSADQVRRNLVTHMTHPVRYFDLIQQIAAEAPTIFVEVGPQQALTRLNARILTNSQPDLIASDNPKRPGVEQLLHVQALLEVCGALDPATEAAPARISRESSHEVIHFDATARRRAKMRQAADQRMDAPSGRPTNRARSGDGAVPLKHNTAKDGNRQANGTHPVTTSEITGVSQESNGVTKSGLPLPPRISVPAERATVNSAESATAVITPPVAKSTPTATHSEVEDESDGSGQQSLEELESFLVNFVVEQTGYPPEVVELDADLEADLGIDSIKKAQLFGELQEYFDVTPEAGVTLDDFPTLRHVVTFLSKSTSSSEHSSSLDAPASPEPVVLEEKSDAPQEVIVEEQGAETPSTWPTTDVVVVQLRGSSYDIGYQHGVEMKREIRRALRRIADLSGGQANELPLPARISSEPEHYFAPHEMDELRGIAAGAEVSLGSVVAWNLILLAELGTSATHIVIAGRKSASAAPLHGLREDLCLMSCLSDCLTPVVQIREQSGRQPIATVTIAGFVGALAGMNAHRLAVSGLASGIRERVDGVVPGPHLLLTTQVLGKAGAIGEAIDQLQTLEARNWSCCLSQAGNEQIALVNTREDKVTVHRSSDVVTVSAFEDDRAAGFATEAQETEDRLTTSWMMEQLHRSGEAVDRRMLIVIDPENGEFRVGFGSDDDTGGLPTIPVAPLLGPVLKRPSRPEHEASDRRATARKALDEFVNEETRTQRFVMTMVPANLPSGTNSSWQAKGPAVILGNNPVAAALRQQLTSRGVTVHQLQATTRDEAIAELDQVWSQGPAPHLFLTSPRETGSQDLTAPDVWQQVSEDQVLTPFFVCQRWLQLADAASWIDDCTVVAVTNLGGDFGFASDLQSPQSGGLTGLMKALCLEYFVLREHQGFLAKAIDAPADENPDSLAASILAELASGALDYEVAYVNGQRLLQLAEHKEVNLHEAATIRPGSTWIVTGGARGITAESALELGRRFGLKLHLIGSSPAPSIPADKQDLDEAGVAQWRGEVMISAREQGIKPNEAWARVEKTLEMHRSLRKFEDAGVHATYHQCDVGDRSALAAVLDEIRRIDGPIEGILHGAGIERSCRFKKKSLENVQATFDAKVAGAYHLMTLTLQDPVSHFLAYGSISGRLGSNGQTDYCAASDWLCKLSSWYRRLRPECRTIAFHWHPWDEVGMAARPETKASLERTNGPTLMPKTEGVRHLIREVCSPQEDCEVLITDWEFHQRYYPEPEKHDPAKERRLTTDGEPTRTAETRDTDTAIDRIASRNVMRLVDAPLSSDEICTHKGSALILGNNASAIALRDRLKLQGVTVRVLPAEDAEQTISEMEAIWSDTPCRSLFLMCGREPKNDLSLTAKTLSEQTERSVLLPYLVTQRWVQLLKEDDSNSPAILAAAVNLGGNFGFEGDVAIPSGGALCGLLKSVHVEHVRNDSQQFIVKVIDAPAEEPADQLAQSILHEVGSGSPEVEVAWANGQRRVVRCQPTPLSREASSTQHGGDSPPTPRHGGTWVITGGARGITAAAALDLGRRYGLKLHLIGKSPAPEPNAPWRNATHAELKLIKRKIVMQAVAEGRSPEEGWDRVRKDREIFESLQKFAEAGVEVTYHSCDVTDRAALDRVLQQIRNTDGPIEGVIHGAGYAKSARFETQSVDRVRRTMTPKIEGALFLMSLTRQDPLKHFIAFGSLSGRFGGNGLADYAAANDMLAKLCDWYRGQRPDCRTCCFHWQTWDRIGMAMIADGVEITKNAFKMEFLSPEEGVAHLHDELCGGMPDSEVLITDGYFETVFYPNQPASLGSQSEATASEFHAASQNRPQQSVPGALPQPLLEGIERESEDRSATATVLFHPENDPFLAQHRLRDKPFLPGVVGIEALLQSAAAYEPDHDVHSIRDVVITNGLSFPTDAPLPAAVRMVPDGNRLVCRLTTEFRNRQGRVVDPQRLHVSGVVDLAGPSDFESTDAPGRPPLGWFPHQYADDGLLTHGPAFRCLTDIAYQYDGGWGRIVAPDPHDLGGGRGADGWMLPLAVLDACLVTCGSFVFLQFAGQFEVPHGFERLQWTRQPRPGETCIVRTFFHGRDERHSAFDFTLYGENDEPLLQAVGYRTIRVGGNP